MSRGPTTYVGRMMVSPPSPHLSRATRSQATLSGPYVSPVTSGVSGDDSGTSSASSSAPAESWSAYTEHVETKTW